MKEKRLGDVELEIYQVISDLGEASVQEVVDVISTRRKVAYTSVMTLMKNMADKQFLKFKKDGKKYIYSPKLKPQDLKQNLLSKTLNNVFNGSALDLVQHLVKSEQLSKSDIDDIKSMLDKME